MIKTLIIIGLYAVGFSLLINYASVQVVIGVLFITLGILSDLKE